MLNKQPPTNRRSVLALASLVGVAVGSAGLAAGMSSGQAEAQPAAVAVGSDGVYNVVADFGATGDGQTDDTAAIQAACDACRSAGGGTVYFPPGTYMISTAQRQGGLPQGYAWATGFMVGANTKLAGAGKDAVTIRLLANQPGTVGLGSNNAAIITPWGVSQERMAVEDLTVDGNSASQQDQINGIFMWRCRGVTISRVRVKDCLGINVNGGSSETFCFYSNQSADHSYLACEAVQTGSAPVSDGFYAVGCTNVSYVNCRAIGIRFFGFNAGDSRAVQYDACEAYLCGQEGYHIDDPHASQIHYIGCIAGTVAAAENGTYPFSSEENLGNNYGFACSVAATHVIYVGCSAVGNRSDGFHLTHCASAQLTGCVSGSNGSAGMAFSQSKALVTGGWVTNNSTGLFFGTVTDAQTVHCSGGLVVSGNSNRNLSINNVAYNVPGNVAAPALPASGTALFNPFPYAASACITPGTSACSVAISGVATGITLPAGGPGQMFRIPAGATVTLSYTKLPTWTWWLG